MRNRNTEKFLACCKTYNDICLSFSVKFNEQAAILTIEMEWYYLTFLSGFDTSGRTEMKGFRISRNLTRRKNTRINTTVDDTGPNFNDT